MKWLRKIYYRLFKRYQRLELKYLHWDEADEIIKSAQHGNEEEKWHIAKEEDNNRVPYTVYIERRKRIT